MINEQLVLSSDLLIALFGNKMGTRTTSGNSGTVEEINVFYEKNKSGIGVFFVDDLDVPHDLIKERVVVDEYKEYLSKTNRGLYQSYSKRNIQLFLNKNIGDLTKTLTHENNTKKEFDLFDDIQFDIDEQLLIIFSIEELINQFGDRWKSKSTLIQIKNWENANNMTSYLSDKYDSALYKLKVKGIIEPVEFTSEGNPKLYTYANGYYESFKTLVREETILTNQRKSDFRIDAGLNYETDDLPF